MPSLPGRPAPRGPTPHPRPTATASPPSHPAGIAPPRPARLLPVPEVAARCDVSPRHVRRLIAGGRLPVHRIGRAVRVAEADLQHFLSTCRVQVQ